MGLGKPINQVLYRELRTIQERPITLTFVFHESDEEKGNQINEIMKKAKNSIEDELLKIDVCADFKGEWGLKQSG